MTHPYIPKCLSLQSSLGYRGKLKRRTLASSVPWAIVQLRHASVLFAFFFQHTKGSPNEAHDPGKYYTDLPLTIFTNDVAEILRMILGNTRWTLDFSHFVLSEAFDLADEFESVFNDQEAFTQKRNLPSPCPALFLMQSIN